MEEVLSPFKYCQLTNYNLFNTLDSHIWTEIVLQTATKLHIPAIQNNYIHSATFGNKSHSVESYMFSRLPCFLVVLNLTPWATEEYVQIPTIIYKPILSFSMRTSTFLLMGYNRNTQPQRRSLQKFLWSDELKERRIKNISGIPALALHPNRDKVMWKNILRVAYTQTSLALHFKIQKFSVVSTECAYGEFLCFRPI